MRAICVVKTQLFLICLALLLSEGCPSLTCHSHPSHCGKKRVETSVQVKQNLVNFCEYLFCRWWVWNDLLQSQQITAWLRFKRSPRCRRKRRNEIQMSPKSKYICLKFVFRPTTHPRFLISCWTHLSNGPATLVYNFVFTHAEPILPVGCFPCLICFVRVCVHALSVTKCSGIYSA